ncbi:pilus assembly protein [Shewanella zhangzhouensis]|uniref:pilus assembly protein n=1 Tax=Shewanella zhangzhouensis TaxID=2864213 RepID=UPI001C65D799|nr:PilC/PilY family type IV pilus protein [Shewanella zhangzhouensis]QYK06205.1 type IV pilin biogenesis protein [Shewanella zhangzhouensis]
MKFNQILFAGLVTASVLPAQSFADDTDLYLNPAANNVRPQVLIIFDNSGSMDTIVEGLPGGYESSEDYPPLDSANSYDDGMVYFAIGVGIDEAGLGIPDSPSETNRFNVLLNGCTVAREALGTYGRFTGYIREYITSGNGKGTWQPIKNNSGKDQNNPVDCYEDIPALKTDNNSDITSFSAGYPVDSLKSGNGNNAVYIPWGASPGVNGFNTGELVTLYSANYLRWYRHYQKAIEDGTAPGEYPDQTRLAIAKTAISSVISTVPSVDFGLAVFNLNFPNEGDSDGGRIVAGIKQRTASEKEALINTITNLPAETNTPLCETLYEAYRYFSGGAIQFGHSDSDYNGNSDGINIKYDANKPMYDTSIESGGSYISPLSKCNRVAHVIYITDGAPVLDKSADDFVEKLGGAPFTYRAAEGEQPAKESYLPALAEYMFNNDLSDAEGFQRVVTHTIGFSLGEDEEAAEPLLIETAKRSTDAKSGLRGTYSRADNTVQLIEAITKLIGEIDSNGQRFSAPGVAYSSADPTRTLDAAYYALFEPSPSPKWTGNLKKLKVNSSGALVDVNGDPAIDSSGSITNKACTIWSDCSANGDKTGYLDENGDAVDGGNIVAAGGAARSIVPRERRLFSDLGGLKQFSANDGPSLPNISSTISMFSSVAGGESNLASYMGIPTENLNDELIRAFEWIQGWNVDVASYKETGEVDEYTSIDIGGVRADIMGDPLHSQPLAIDYGDHTKIFVGTNHGMMHAFKDTSDVVSESWAFMPYELLPNVSVIRRNDYSMGHGVYGIDGSPVAYIERNGSEISKAWLFFGMRRGGQSYYALDVTSDTPVFKWKISNESDGFGDLGQTWSTPVVTKIPGFDGPVLIFGGGYNAGYDSGGGKNASGRMVYIVDASNGELLHSFGATADTTLPNIQDSIVGSIATLDSNSDGYTDRLYAADLGGNVWRMDLPSADKSTWSGFKFAELGGNLPSTDRRFFYEPSVAQTYFTNTTEVTVTDESGTTTTVAYQNVPYDAVTLGSGNRADPLSLNAEDMFFVLQDRYVVSQQFGDGATAIPSPITFANLYDVTSAAPSTEAENIAFGTKLGWYYNFAVTGEKSLSPSVIIKGKVYFTSFIPTQPSANQDVCSVSSVGRLYTLDLHKGTRYTESYIKDVCDNCIPQPPKIITPPPCDSDTCTPEELLNPPPPVLIIGKGNCDQNGENCTGTVDLESGLTTNKIYYHIDE